MMTGQAHNEHPDQRAMGLVAQAVQWAAAGRPDHATYFYQAALDFRPTDTRTRMQLADCLVRCNASVQATTEYLRVAEDYAARRRDREAMAICYRALHLDARQLVYVAMGSMLRRIGRQARTLCAHIAETHLAAGRVADGLHMLNLGAEIDAKNPAVRQRLAALYLSQHMITDAVRHWAEAGRLLLAAGNNAEYVEVAQRLLAHDPRHLHTLRELPRVLLLMGEPHRAVAGLSELMRTNPGDPVGYEILAHAYAVIGRTSTALSVLQRLVDELRAAGHRDGATQIIARARQWRPEDTEFTAAVQSMRGPKAPPPPPQARPTTNEGTVILNLADLLPSDGDHADGGEVLDASDLIEIEASVVGPAPARPPLGRPPTPPPPRTAAQEQTQCIDISEIELDEDTAIRRVPQTVAQQRHQRSSSAITTRSVTCPPTAGPPPLPGPPPIPSRRLSGIRPR